MRYNSNKLEMKTSSYLYRKINFKLLTNNQIGPARRANITKMFWYLFFSSLDPQCNISPAAQYSPTLSNLIVLLLQKFESTLTSSTVASLERDHFNPSSYLKLWIGCVHQSYIVGASFGDYFLKEKCLEQTILWPCKTGHRKHFSIFLLF